MTAITDWITKWAAVCPEKTAIHHQNRKISYGDFDRKITETAAMLSHSLKLGRGDRVAFLGQNHPRMLYLLFACARIGAIFVPLNWRLTPAEHIHMLINCGASALFVEEDYQDHCEILKQKLPRCRLVTWGGRKKPGWLGLRHLMEMGKGHDPVPKSNQDDPLLLIYTSGTTGFPKGAVLRRTALEYNALNSIHMHDMTHDDVIMTILPMFHVGGLNIQTMAAFSLGATVLLLQNFDVEQTINAINSDRPSLAIILPAHMAPLQAHEKWPQVDLSCFRAVTTGSCVIPKEMTRFWHDRKIPLLQVYGSSETCPIAIHQRAENAFDTEDSIGFAAKYCEARIVDDQGKDCDDDQPGEILIKGPNVMAFYWQDEDATTAALKDQWYYTGDIGYRDARGCYHFVDRKKDMIISGSENIYPAELEVVLGSHPEIREVAVVGRPDDRWGEIVVAFIVLNSASSLSQAEILDWLGPRLGRYKHPRIFHFIDEMPRNEMRKILKQDLRARA